MAPASAYASEPRNGSAIVEFKSLIKAFHNAGMAVILDVVYNHVGIPNHLASLDRELYFSTDAIGRLTNHSGCGNDLNCQSEPARKLVMDSVKYLVQTFDLDGFRFDLGELLGMELLKEMETELREIKPGIVLIAEPWSFRGRLPIEMNETGYSLWSDSCREKSLVSSRTAHLNQEWLLTFYRASWTRTTSIPGNPSIIWNLMMTTRSLTGSAMQVIGRMESPLGESKKKLAWPWG